MGYEDVLYEAERLGREIGELISDLNTTQYHDDAEIYAHLIVGLLKNCGEREKVLTQVRELVEKEVL